MHSPKAMHILDEFHQKIMRLPFQILLANDTHPLAQFSGDYTPQLNCILQQPHDQLQELVRQGDKGLLVLHKPSFILSMSIGSWEP
jgi:hypothetical protein